MDVNSYPSWLEINLSAVEHNTRFAIATAKTPFMAVVKANAYGHGAVEVSKASLAGGASWLAVARYCEAEVLRQAGISAPVLVLGLTMPHEVDEAIQNNVSICLPSFEAAEVYSQRAKALGKQVKVHLKVDTGMGRLGVLTEEALPLARRALELGGLELEGMFSHFSMGDYDQHPHTALQIKRFKEAVASLDQAGIHPRWVHLANSAGTLFEPEARFTLVRGGSILVGIRGRSALPYPPEMRRAMSWKACLASSKLLPPGFGIGYSQTYTTSSEEMIGVVPVGYGDGFRRYPDNQALIDGRRVPVVGKVCMDQFMVRLPKRYPIYTEVVLLGKQGNEEITIEELSQRWKASEVDVPTIINRRIPRVYVHD